MTATATTLRLLHGDDEPLAELRPLRAGPLTVMLDGVEVRYVRLGEVELVRRIYAAVRDRNWNTIPGVASEVAVREHGDSFKVSFRVRHSSHETDFSWEGTIVGTPDGRIRFGLDGQAKRSMLYNRIGFCVLHPWREYAGRAFRGETPDGPIEGSFPDSVAPQRFENGVYVPLFPSVRSLAVDLGDRAGVRLEFEGDLFETEDQRNWTDASFKTYCTPMALGFPHRLEAGETRSQAVTVSATERDDLAPRSVVNPRRPRLEFAGPSGRRVPPIGLAHPSGASELTDADAQLLRLLAPAHLRTELHLDQADWPDELAGAIVTAERIGAQLELAVSVPGEGHPGALEQLRALIGDRTGARVLVVPEGAHTTTPEETTPPALVRLVRDALALPEVPVAGGTDMYFCELNRTRPQVDDMDGVFWSLNPQVHAFDDVSLLETPEAQGEQVRTAIEFAPDRAIFVGPVTLKRRYNVNATVAEDDDAGGLPDSVDPRQAALIGAAWTLASAKHLSEQGADAITYFETAGWRGVLQGDGEPPAPERFPARAGQVFPLFHVLADVAELSGAEILACRTDRPLEVAGLAARRGDGEGATVLVGNLTPRTLTVGLGGLASRGRIRRLNSDTAEEAMFHPEQFRKGVAQAGDLAELGLGPYETVRIDT